MSSPAPKNDRRVFYKNAGRDLDASRRKREDETVQLRKGRREDQVSKRRNLGDLNLDSQESDNEANTNAVSSPLDDNNARNRSMSSPEMIYQELNASENDNDEIKMTPGQLLHAMRSKDDEVVFDTVVKLRKALSKEPAPPIDQILKTGVLSDLVPLMSRLDNRKLLFESTWAITNIASGTTDQTRQLIEAGAIKPLISLLSSGYGDVREQAVWAIGNIAGDCYEYRDLLLTSGVMSLLCQILENGAPSMSLRRNLAWTISNLNRNKLPPTDFSLCRPCIKPLAKLLRSTNDKETVVDCCWAFSYISDGENDRIAAVIESDIVPKLVSLLGHDDVEVVAAAGRAVGNIVTGDDHQTQVVLNAGAVPLLRKMLKSHRDQLIKETCWTLSNIAAGSSAQIEFLALHGIFPLLIEVINTGEMRSRKEAVWCLTNATSGGTAEQVRKLLDIGLLEAFVDVMNLDDAKILLVVLSGIENLLRAGQVWAHRDLAENMVALKIESLGGLDRIEALQGHPNGEIYKKALSLIEKYFSDSDDVEAAVNPVPENGVFQFGIQRQGYANNLNDTNHLNGGQNQNDFSF